MRHARPPCAFSRSLHEFGMNIALSPRRGRCDARCARNFIVLDFSAREMRNGNRRRRRRRRGFWTSALANCGTLIFWTLGSGLAGAHMVSQDLGSMLAVFEYRKVS